MDMKEKIRSIEKYHCFTSNLTIVWYRYVISCWGCTLPLTNTVQHTKKCKILLFMRDQHVLSNILLDHVLTCDAKLQKCTFRA